MRLGIHPQHLKKGIRVRGGVPLILQNSKIKEDSKLRVLYHNPLLRNLGTDQWGTCFKGSSDLG